MTAIRPAARMIETWADHDRETRDRPNANAPRLSFSAKSAGPQTVEPSRFAAFLRV
jgi:hypothetical protein